MLASQVQHVRSIYITYVTRFYVDASEFWIFTKAHAPIGVERRNISRSEDLHHLTRSSVKVETTFVYHLN